jgi:hypothetical protein
MDMEKKEEKKAEPIKSTPMDRLEALSRGMVNKAVGYGKSNAGRYIIGCANAIAGEAKLINQTVTEIDAVVDGLNKAITQKDSEILWLMGENRVLKAGLGDKCSNLSLIMSSRLWPIYKRLIGYRG